MIFKQFYLNCLAHASYLIGDEETRTAAVVDPQRDVEPYLEEAGRHGLQIRHVFLTHFHADFVAGHLELRDRTAGTRIYLGARARAEYAFTPMKDGDTVEFGRVRLTALETPGHTVESISILVHDLARDATSPFAVLTGDTLFIGDVGRPDLRAALGWSPTELGRLLFESLRTKLLPLPDPTLVYPAHGAGSLCGKAISAETVSTVGEQRRSNYALQPMSQEQFVSLVIADQPDAPEYFTYDAVLNSKEHPTLDANLEIVLTPLPLQRVLELQRSGAQVLDVREAGEFAKGHLLYAINIGLSGQYATWAGTVLSRERPIVIVAEPGREREAVMRLGRIGFDNVSGYLEGGMQALALRSDLLGRTERVTAAVMAEELRASGPSVVLDVRTAREWRAKHVPGSLNVPLNQLPARVGELPRDRRMFVHCAGGYRSSIAISLLQPRGFNGLVELIGGLAAWEAARLPLQRPEADVPALPRT
ncbi:MAG TPA: MBL fold metallo-hydrolase [Vicinamibacterales bacterium]|jgi:glyoxylase-like metal-dependent hydrolase (beta-lactamase superfamily II)/rhodanese-related sulfurtransferase|nr:MBL fold metallo-hydrolase [Vicinamibacterales bacterium]